MVFLYIKESIIKPTFIRIQTRFIHHFRITFIANHLFGKLSYNRIYIETGNRMSRESKFKAYDKKYSQGISLPYEDMDDGFDITEARFINRWPYVVSQHGRQEVLAAVYSEVGAEQWQEFRVSLKGFTTREKLYRLRFRRNQFVFPTVIKDIGLEQIRIDNYIGALVRGGFLNSKYEVIK